MELAPNLVRHIKDVYGDDLESLERAAEAARRLMEHPGWAIVSSLVSREATTVANEVGRDETLRDHPVLANRLGVLEGIRTFEQTANTLIERHRVVLEDQRKRHEGDAASGGAG